MINIVKTVGSQNRTAKLTEKEAQAILDASKNTTTKELAAKYNVSLSTVQGIRAKRQWRHLKRTTVD